MHEVPSAPENRQEMCTEVDPSVSTSWESANGIEFFQTDPAAWVWARQPIDLRVETAFSRLNANPSASGHRNLSDIRCHVLEVLSIRGGLHPLCQRT